MVKKLLLLSALILLFVGGVPAQEYGFVLIGTEAELNTLAVDQRGALAINTGGSSSTDCTFSASTGTYMVHCVYCDSTDTWVVPSLFSGTCALPAAEFVLMETGDYILMETGDKIVLE